MRGFGLVLGAALSAVLLASSAGAGTIVCCELSSDATPASDFDAVFEFEVAGTTLTLTVTNTDGGAGFNINEIYFNASSDVTSLSFTSATHSVALDVTTAWSPLETNPMVDGFDVFDFGLTDGMGETNPDVMEPGESIVFLFAVNAGLDQSDFTVGNGSGYTVAARFVNGPGDDSGFGTTTQIPEPATLGILGLGLAGLVVASRRRS